MKHLYPHSDAAPQRFLQKQWPLAVLFICFGLAALSSCGSDLLTDPRQVVFPETEVSYQNHVQPFLSLSCTFSGCHSRESRAADIDLTSYLEFIGKPGLIVEENPESSVLVQVIDNKLPHRQSFQERITANHIKGVKTWIAEGAKNN